MQIERILKKAAIGNGLDISETEFLFNNITDTAQALDIATQLKIHTKGNFATLYTCLYITNSCVNNCPYCGYKNSNKTLERITLTSEEIRAETQAIKESGITNIILVGSTCLEKKYKELIINGTKNIIKSGLIPWIEFENLSHETLNMLNSIGAKHFTLFQETYNKSLFTEIHKNNFSKVNYELRLKKVNECLNAGFTNINIGALLGLNQDYKTEILGLQNHATSLKQSGAKVCIAMPSTKPTPSVTTYVNKVPDEIIEKAYIVLRLALPEVSLALSGREDEELRNKIFPIIDQIGTGGVPNPGGRTTYKEAYLRGDAQFTMGDKRTPKEIVTYLSNIGIQVKHQIEWV